MDFTISLIGINVALNSFVTLYIAYKLNKLSKEMVGK